MVGHPRGIIEKPVVRLPRWRASADALATLLPAHLPLARQAQLAGQIVAPLARDTMRRLLHRVQGLGRQISALVEPIADDIAIAYTGLQPGDPTHALDLYAGVFTLAGRTVSGNGRSIFLAPSTSRRWSQALHGFAWLRDLAASDTPLARLNARALVEDWIELAETRALAPIADRPEVVALRLLAFVEHAGWLLADATPDFRHRVLLQVTQQFRLLRSGKGRPAARGLAEIHVAHALLATAIAVPAFRRFLPAQARQFDLVLQAQFLADGGHVSRNPSAIVETLACVLPLKAALAHAGFPASQTVMNTIDRMLPMLRYFVGPGGRLAHMNGAAPVVSRLIDTILTHADTQGCAHGNAAHSGYQRISAGGTVLLMDCGVAPPLAHARQAHAGCLSFEFASRTNRFVINCGTPVEGRGAWRSAARATAAHSTVIVDGSSSATILEHGPLARLLGPVLVGGPTQVDVDRREHGGATAVVAGHDGYAASLNLIHERTIRMSEAGDQIDGRDRLLPAGEPDGIGHPYVARFHLAPQIEPVLMTNGVVMLMAPDGEAWEFHCEDCRPTIEESIDLAGTEGPVPTRQIVLSASVPAQPELRWTFLRTRRATVAATSA